MLCCLRVSALGFLCMLNVCACGNQPEEVAKRLEILEQLSSMLMALLWDAVQDREARTQPQPDVPRLQTLSPQEANSKPQQSQHRYFSCVAQRAFCEQFDCMGIKQLLFN